MTERKKCDRPLSAPELAREEGRAWGWAVVVVVVFLLGWRFLT